MVLLCWWRWGLWAGTVLVLALVMAAAVAMLVVQVLVVATVGFDGGSRYDVVVVMMESWLVGARVGPQVVGLGLRTRSHHP